MARLAVSQVYPDSLIGTYSRLDRSIFYGNTNSLADLSDGGNPANFTPVVLWESGPATQNQVWGFESA